MHSNVMGKLINSIKLISFNYMYSSNKTLDRFGIEYSYIASAMGNMLKSTNNSVKNIEINKTVGIAVFDGALYIPAILGAAAAPWLLAFGLAIGSTATMATTCNSSGW
ncbi:MAG: hypothetical protein AMDU4_FER2C00205G0003 [Ferroplasma sp. Type II]|uniref:hypothetical protein n=1 Tax=Ferroplasma sp. Type II TaxID=261388 RepID=UPI000389456B|nr:hypothetical protein [Ferroplasma sp. Type II]EQB70998.1 MAG: hypothetical protein AMDU4_FER2C00205G0003 [Ferroplasma sp. Type II]